MKYSSNCLEVPEYISFDLNLQNIEHANFTII